MSVLKYKDPVTGAWRVCKNLKVVGNVVSPDVTPPGEELLPAVNLPDYVRVEAAEVAAKVRSVLKDDSIVSINLSDSHYVGEKATTNENMRNDAGNLHACMAVKALNYLLPVDYIAHHGDVGRGTAADNNPAQQKQTSDYLAYFREAAGDVPVFVAIGNHDTAIYYHNNQTKVDGGVHTLSGDWLYDNFTALSESANTVTSGESCGGYCYRDFPDKKLRVFMLNTSENLVLNQYDNGTSDTQRLWVAQALQNLNAKADAPAWGFVVISHYALDLGDAYSISDVFKAYVAGESITLNNTPVNFNGCNAARFYCQTHGHWHNFKVDNLHGGMTWSNGEGTLHSYGVQRLCTPNAGFHAENTYPNKVVYGVSFGDAAAYIKFGDVPDEPTDVTTEDPADDTSLVVNVTNPSENIIYSFCYGAGYDRTVSMDSSKTYYSVIKNLDNVSVTNESSAAVEEGENYSCKITVREGCTLDSVAVTMGGVDITSTAYNASTGVVNISSVTGLVIITAKAELPAVNLVTMATTTDGVTPFGDARNGYQKGMFLSSDVPGEITTSAVEEGVTTGWIALSPIGKTIVIKNVSTTLVSYSQARIVGYQELRHGGQMVAIKFDASKEPSGGEIRINAEDWANPTHNPHNYTNLNYIRVCGKWTGSAPEIYVE